MKLNLLTTAIVASGFAMFASRANAGMTTDHHGNVGYDSYNECVAAVNEGSAKFYTPYTYQNPKRQAGEATVKKMALSEVTIPTAMLGEMPIKNADYSAGACDKGVGQSQGRYGVSGALVGKYVPFAADMPVNVYMNSKGEPVRVTMQQCDNHFGSKFPMPIGSKIATTETVAPPEAQVAVNEERSVEAITTEVKRVIRPSTYKVKQVLITPQDQVQRIATAEGTAVTVEGAGGTAYLGNQADPSILNQVEVDEPVVVIEVPNENEQNPVEIETDYTLED
jgi:hypothetical protein